MSYPSDPFPRGLSRMIQRRRDWLRFIQQILALKDLELYAQIVQAINDLQNEKSTEKETTRMVIHALRKHPQLVMQIELEGGSFLEHNESAGKIVLTECNGEIHTFSTR